MSKSDYDDEEGIVLEAGGELFTVGRCRLVQESALFRDLFALAGFHGPDRQDGTLESPVRTGDDPTMFRDFLWALRVRPAELMDFVESARTPEKAVKLTNVACLAHKYQDEGLAQWALRQLYNALSSTGFALEGAVLKPLLRTLALFDDGTASVKPLHGLLRSRAEAAQSATPNLVDLIGLVEACTTSGYMSLLPMAYYALLVSPLDIDWLDDTRLTESNKRHLMPPVPLNIDGVSATFLEKCWSQFDRPGIKAAPRTVEGDPACLTNHYPDAFSDTHGLSTRAPFDQVITDILSYLERRVERTFEGVLPALTFKFGNVKEPAAFCPLLVTSCVESQSIRFEDAKTVADSIKSDILSGKASFGDVDVAIWELRVSFSCAARLRVPASEFTDLPHRNANGEPALLVLKNAYTTGTTTGSVSQLRSEERDAFSEKGNSGSAVVDRGGRIVALLTGSAGRNVTFAASFCHLVERIQEALPEARLLDAVD
ncbi:hypothetical protein AURDEDRAFT_187843 [Auricularia subglabra TFB-10046 SS5]|nr:hypothetical protein AURDEDRAFT_187843 [Auricularia subglabra TFB-10046 SS5]